MFLGQPEQDTQTDSCN